MFWVDCLRFLVRVDFRVCLVLVAGCILRLLRVEIVAFGYFCFVCLSILVLSG